MKYFSKKMYQGFQIPKSDKWEDLYIKNRKKYKSYLKKITPRLNRVMKSFFLNFDFHDSLINGIVLKNNAKVRTRRGTTNELMVIGDGRTDVILELVSIESKKIQVKFKDVFEYLVETDSEQKKWVEDAFGYCVAFSELEVLRNGKYSFELLLHSGSAIKIGFKTFSWKNLKK